jgi:hypothetical protein
VKTYPLFFSPELWHSAASDVLTQHQPKQERQGPPLLSIVENHRLPGSQTVQRTVLYLGEIHDQQQASWRKTLEAFDEEEQHYTTMSLFPDDRDFRRMRWTV